MLNKAKIMYIISYVLSIFNFIFGVLLVIVILPIGYLLLTEGSTPDKALVYVVHKFDEVISGSEIEKDIEIDSKKEKIDEFAKENGYTVETEFGCITFTLPEYGTDTGLTYDEMYAGNHQQDAVVMGYYTDQIKKIEDFSKELENIKVDIWITHHDWYGELYNGKYIEKTGRNIEYTFKN